MTEEKNSESEEKVKRRLLNVYLMVIGVIVAGLSFAWHIIAPYFKG